MSVRNTRKFSRSRDRFRTDLRKRFFGEPSMKIRRLMAKYSPTGKKSKSKSVGKSFTPYRSSRQAVRNLTDEDVKIINKDVRAWLKFILNINNMIFDFPGASHDIILHLFILEMHTIYLRSDKKNKKEALLEMEKQIDTFKISKYMLNAEKDLIDVEMQFVFPPDLKITYDIKDKVRELKAYSSHFIKEYLTYDYDYNIVRLSNTYFHPVFMARIMGKTNEDARFRIKY